MNKRAVAIIIKDKNILLMHRIREGREYFVFPGGGVEENESIEEAVIREIKEEFDLDITIDKLLFEIENQNRREYYFLAKRFVGVPKISGEEKERMTRENQYDPAWKPLGELASISNLYPDIAKRKLIEIFTKQNKLGGG